MPTTFKYGFKQGFSVTKGGHKWQKVKDRGGEKIKKEIVAAGTVALLITVMFGSLAAAQEVVFEMDDPEGDDYGYGDYTYPLADVFVPGVFDIVRFEVSTTADEVIFTFELKELGGDPWGAGGGFCLQFIQVYIDNDRVEGSGRTDTLNYVNLTIDSGDAWEVALSIAGGWVEYHDLANQIFVGTDNYVGEMDIWGDNVAYTVTAKVPIEIIGEPKFILYAASSTKDTDFMVKLVEVYNDRKALNILDSGVRTRFRDGIDNPSLITPNEVVKYEILLGATGIYIPKGHRLRIEITSSNFPCFTVNSNLGGEQNEKGFTIAHQKVIHDSQHPSKLILPIYKKY